jgi:hypothetical protein
MQSFKVVFQTDKASLTTFVNLDDDLLIALAKAQIDPSQITYKFFDSATVRIERC